MSGGWLELVTLVVKKSPHFVKIIIEHRDLQEEKKKLLEELAVARDSYKKLEDKSITPNAEFIGWYNERLMHEITSFLEKCLERRKRESDNDAANRSASSITIALDFAAFGAITWSDLFEQQEAIIEELCHLGQRDHNPVKIIVNSNETNRQVIQSQYTLESYDKDYPALLVKLGEWVNSRLFNTLANEEKATEDLRTNKPLDQISNAFRKRKKISRDLYLEAFLKFNDLLVSRYRTAYGDVHERKSLVPLHGWFSVGKNIDTEGIIGLVDVKAVWNEPGFRVRGEVATRMKQLVDLFPRENNGLQW